MEIAGRLTADSQVNTLQDERQVVHFSIAINDSYKPKDSNEIRQITTYVNCSYWLSANVANWLKKGALVQLYGRIGMNVWVNSQGEAAGSLTFHINDLKVLAFPKQTEENEIAVSGQQVTKSAAEADDLPF